MNETKQNPPRKAYQKPRLEQVRLVPSEAVLANCKVGSQTGPNTTCLNLSYCDSAS
jgi:hypothetical protein